MNFKCAEWLNWRRGAVTLCALAAAAQPGVAQAPVRVASINLCTDQLVLALADADQIAGLGRFARHAEMSFHAARAATFPILRGSAEEVLRLKPDVVLAGAFSGRATRAMLEAHKVRVETFGPPRDVAEAKAEIERAGNLLGQQARAARLTGEIDTAVAAAKAASSGRQPVTALALQRRGFAAGRDTLLSAAMETAGFSNAASALGVASFTRATLEAVVKVRPGALLIEDLGAARDQSTAILRHPALANAASGTRVIEIPVAEMTCGGPALPALTRRLTSALQKDPQTP